jgi:pantoate--beta-alanine ligase
VKIVKTISEMQNISINHKKEGKTIAVVPTMGYFHDGHISLMKYARENADIIIVTLFVNPTQFAPDEDFDRYPRDTEQDSRKAEENNCDYLFRPTVEEMYPFGFITEIRIGGVTEKFEGVTRPFHFNGVTTIVSKLFNATLPDIAVFGQKDYQQTIVIKQLIRDLNYNIKIDIVPTLREPDGLAMSSRNIYLSAEYRKKAPGIYKALISVKKSIEKGLRKRSEINSLLIKKISKTPELKIDYACAADAETLEEPDEFRRDRKIVLLAACYLGKTRLIDNIVV